MQIHVSAKVSNNSLQLARRSIEFSFFLKREVEERSRLIDGDLDSQGTIRTGTHTVLPLSDSDRAFRFLPLDTVYYLIFDRGSK